MMASHTSRKADTSGYRQIHTDSDDADEDYESDNVVPQTQRSERSRQNDNADAAPSIAEVENPDRLVQNVYAYYSRGGLLCMVVEDVLQLVQFTFVIAFSFYLVECVNYSLLFSHSSWLPPRGVNETWWNELPAEMRAWLDHLMNSTQDGTHRKLSLADIIEPIGQCAAHFSGLACFLLIVSLCVLAFRTLKFIARLNSYLHTRRFFQRALHYSDASQLASATWNDVQQRLIVHCRNAPQFGRHVDELHIHQRLLRYCNYMIALTTSNTLPVRFNVPLYGSHVYLSDALKWNLEFSLFIGPFSPFRGGETLPDAFTKRRAFAEQRARLVAQLARQLQLLGWLNLALFPLVALFQLFNFTFRYAAELRQNPTAVSARHWTNFSKLRCRHYNEPGEQFDKRLACAYRPACDYLAGFRSRLTVVIARSVMFIAGAFLAVFVLLSLIDSDVLLMDNVLVTMTALTLIIGACRSLLPDPTVYFNPDYLFFKYASYIDYAHVRASDRAAFARLVREPHTRHSVAEMLQYRLVGLLEELASPLLTPIVLIFAIAPAADRLVDFLNANTIRVEALGDVCSGAHFDMRSHRNPLWTSSLTEALPLDDSNLRLDDRDTQSVPLHAKDNDNAAEKMFVSFVNFHERNPTWTPPQQEQSRFLAEKARDEAVTANCDTASSQTQTQTQTQSTLETNESQFAHSQPSWQSRHLLEQNPLFLTSMCDSMMRDEWSSHRNGEPVTNASQNAAPSNSRRERERESDRPASIARSIMFVRDRYERNRRAFAERNTNSLYSKPQAASTSGSVRFSSFNTAAQPPKTVAQLGAVPESHETYSSAHSNLVSVYHAARNDLSVQNEVDENERQCLPPTSARLPYWSAARAQDGERRETDSDSDIEQGYDAPPVMQTVGHTHYSMDDLLPPVNLSGAVPSHQLNQTPTLADPNEEQPVAFGGAWKSEHHGTRDEPV